MTFSYRSLFAFFLNLSYVSLKTIHNSRVSIYSETYGSKQSLLSETYTNFPGKVRRENEWHLFITNTLGNNSASPKADHVSGRNGISTTQNRGGVQRTSTDAANLSSPFIGESRARGAATGQRKRWEEKVTGENGRRDARRRRRRTAGAARPRLDPVQRPRCLSSEMVEKGATERGPDRNCSKRTGDEEKKKKSTAK